MDNFPSATRVVGIDHNQKHIDTAQEQYDEDDEEFDERFEFLYVFFWNFQKKIKLFYQATRRHKTTAIC